MNVSSPATQVRPEPLARVFGWLLLAYLVLVTALSRGFARFHLNVAGVPLFTAELTILTLTALLAAMSLRRRRPALRVGVTGWLLLAYLLIGSIFAAVGLARGFGLAAIRDFALVYYLVFFFFVLAFLQNGGSVAQIVWAMAAGAVVGAAITVGEFIVAPRLHWEHAAPGYVALTAWVAATWLAVQLRGARRWSVRALYLVAILICTASIYLSAYRTIAAVIVAGTAVYVVFSWWFSRGEGARATIVAAAWFAVVGIAIVGHALATRERGAQLPTNGPTTWNAGMRVVSARWAKGLELPGRTRVAVVEAVEESGERSVGGASAAARKLLGRSEPGTGTGADTEAIPPPEFTIAPYPTNQLVDSVGFRKLAWRNAIARIRNAPAVGMGFGPKAALFPDRFCELVSAPLSNCGTAHNTFLTLAMRVGIPVFLFFVAINVLVLARFVRTHVRRNAGGLGVVPPFLLAVLTGFAVYSMTSLFLESPYLAVLYWVVLACIGHLSAKPGPAQAFAPVGGEGERSSDRAR